MTLLIPTEKGFSSGVEFSWLGWRSNGDVRYVPSEITYNNWRGFRIAFTKNPMFLYDSHCANS